MDEKKRLCPNCRTELDGDAKFCTECGSRIDYMFTREELQCSEKEGKGLVIPHDKGELVNPFLTSVNNIQKKIMEQEVKPLENKKRKIVFKESYSEVVFSNEEEVAEETVEETIEETAVEEVPEEIVEEVPEEIVEETAVEIAPEEIEVEDESEEIVIEDEAEEIIVEELPEESQVEEEISPETEEVTEVILEIEEEIVEIEAVEEAEEEVTEETVEETIEEIAVEEVPEETVEETAVEIVPEEIEVEEEPQVEEETSPEITLELIPEPIEPNWDIIDKALQEIEESEQEELGEIATSLEEVAETFVAEEPQSTTVKPNRLITRPVGGGFKPRK